MIFQFLSLLKDTQRLLSSLMGLFVSAKQRTKNAAQRHVAATNNILLAQLTASVQESLAMAIRTHISIYLKMISIRRTRVE